MLLWRIFYGWKDWRDPHPPSIVHTTSCMQLTLAPLLHHHLHARFAMLSGSLSRQSAMSSAAVGKASSDSYGVTNCCCRRYPRAVT